MMCCVVMFCCRWTAAVAVFLERVANGRAVTNAANASETRIVRGIIAFAEFGFVVVFAASIVAMLIGARIAIVAIGVASAHF